MTDFIGCVCFQNYKRYTTHEIVIPTAYYHTIELFTVFIYSCLNEFYFLRILCIHSTELAQLYKEKQIRSVNNFASQFFFFF